MERKEGGSKEEIDEGRRRGKVRGKRVRRRRK